MPQCLDLSGDVMRAAAGLQAFKAARHIGKVALELAARYLDAQHDSAAFVEADEMERVLKVCLATRPGHTSWHDAERFRRRVKPVIYRGYKRPATQRIGRVDFMTLPDPNPNSSNVRVMQCVNPAAVLTEDWQTIFRRDDEQCGI